MIFVEFDKVKKDLRWRKNKNSGRDGRPGFGGSRGLPGPGGNKGGVGDPGFNGNPGFRVSTNNVKLPCIFNRVLQ